MKMSLEYLQISTQLKLWLWEPDEDEAALIAGQLYFRRQLVLITNAA